ncbi:hypothetical protein KHQ88_05655 [Mycoplasmatota bacterium]|nr:hypothetical protein KHQ88_05655 [Mycoplasmatota bacterium]
MKKRLHLSLLALIGSVVLFVVASFAWLAISKYVDIDMFEANMSGISIDSTISVSDDDLEYIETESIDFRGAMPGDVKYYQVEIQNSQNFPIEVNVFLTGFYSTYSGPDTEPNSLSLFEVLEFASYLDDIEIISSNYLGEILADQPNFSDARISVSNDFIIPAGASRTVYFTFGLDGSVGNEYFYKGITINNISIEFDQAVGE